MKSIVHIITPIITEGIRSLDDVDPFLRADLEVRHSLIKNGPASIECAVDEALSVPGILEEAIRTGTPRPVSTKDLLAAVERHRPSTTEWFTTAKNYAMFANKSGLYDDILKYLK